MAPLPKSSPDDPLDVVVIGCGISGLATLKCCVDAGLERTFAIERSEHLGGLWQFREKEAYGVMSFTHINVSKHNYCFSDYPFPDDTPDYPSHEQMASYINSYAEHNRLRERIAFGTEVTVLRRHDGPARCRATGERLWEVAVAPAGYDAGAGGRGAAPTVLYARRVAVASGHHGAPSSARFPGLQDGTFPGRVLHSAAFKDTDRAGLRGKRVLVVGIGNSAVDAAVNLANNGARAVTVSTRSGAWVVPNYLFGCPTDHYACRFFLALPWKLASPIFEAVIKLHVGSPFKWGLNPKYKALQSQPTVSGTLIYHIQRGQVKVRPNVVEFKSDGSCVFTDGSNQVFDAVVLCTGFTIDLPFLQGELRRQCYLAEDAGGGGGGGGNAGPGGGPVLAPSNVLTLFKNVFCPEVGASLGFVGFVQPASGGILSMAETQARWFAELARGACRPLPPARAMRADIARENAMVARRWGSSARHTIQRDPIPYCDAIAALFGVSLWRAVLAHPGLAWRLLLGSAGAAQWRLVGPGRWAGAASAVRGVPVTGFMKAVGLVCGALLAPYAWRLVWWLARALARMLFSR